MRPAASLAEGPAATSARAKDMVEVGKDERDGDGGPLLDVEDDAPAPGTPQRHLPLPGFAGTCRGQSAA